MSTTNSAEISRLAPGTSPNPNPGPKSDLEGLTTLISLALTARARLRLEQGGRDLALADLKEALRHEPGNNEAIELRHQIQGERVGAEPGSTGLVIQGITGEGEPWPHHRAGYQVMARYPDNPGRCDDPLGPPYPLTAQGRMEAIEFARRMCSDATRTQRRELFDAYWTGGEDFDAVVVEFRSLAREVHLEKALDEDDETLDARDADS